MEDHMFRAMVELDGDSWYYRSKRSVIAYALGLSPRRFSKAVDIGCGTGRNAGALIPFFTPAAEYIGIEPHEMPFDPPTGIRSRIIRERAEDVTREDIGGDADLVLLIDVLEHMDEDAGLRAVSRLISPDGTLLVTVPAYPVLWGKNDVQCHHLRRYTPSGLKTALERNGFEIIAWNHYFLFAFVPLLLFSRSGISRSAGYAPRWLGLLLSSISACETRLSRYVRLPFGTGMVCLARPRKAA